MKSKEQQRIAKLKSILTILKDIENKTNRIIDTVKTFKKQHVNMSK